MAAINSNTQTEPKICLICRDEEGALVSVSGPSHPFMEHLFHEHCIRPWVIQAERPLCPACRIPITQINGVRMPHLGLPRPEEHPLVIGASANDLSGVQNGLAGENILPGVIQLAIEIAARQGHGPIVQAILNRQENLRGPAVVAAVSTGQIALVNTLLAPGPIEQQYRDEALETGVREERVGIVNMLLQNGPISSDAFESSLVIAATGNNGAVVQALLDHQKISEVTREIVLGAALIRGKEKIVLKLLMNGRISFWFRVGVMRFAWVSGQRKICTFIFVHGLCQCMLEIGSSGYGIVKRNLIPIVVVMAMIYAFYQRGVLHDSNS